MKIGAKLVMVISIFNIIGIGVLVCVTVIQSEREISRLADAQAKSIAGESGERISRWFEGYIGLARTLAHIMEGYKTIPATERREQFNMMMKQILAANPDLIGMYANWSPNTLDGMDAEYANTPGADETGRFMPAWKYVNGEFMINPIVGFGWDAVMQTPLFNSEYILDPAIYPGQDGAVLIANMGNPVRDKDTGVLIGLSGTSLGLSQIQAIAEEIKPFGDGFALVFSSGGIVAAHADERRLGMNMRESEADTFGPFLNTMIDAVSKGSPASFSYRPSQSKTAIQYYSLPFFIGRVPQPWTLVVGVSRNTIIAPVYHMIGVCLVIGVLTILMMSAGVVFMARSISRPISHTMMTLKDIAEGDLTKKISVSSQDELGDLARYVNFMVDKIKTLVVSIKREATTLSETGGELGEHIAGTAASINGITETIQSVTSQSGSQEASVKDAGEAMGEVVKNIGGLNIQIQKQTECVNQSSSAVEEMLANIQSVTQTLMNSEGNITNLADASEIGRTGLAEVSGDILEIARESAGLLEINAVMQNIASQTNLLSMNAAIEAAHAGEAGKGFAVVADEIRKLAESSSAQSKTISGVLKRIKGSIDKITKSTEGVLLKFEAISDGVRKVIEQEANVRTAMEEQGAGSKSILESINSLQEITGEVTRGSLAMEGKSRKVITESRELEMIAKEINGDMREMSSEADQIWQAVKLVDDISVNNKKQIETLMSEVSRFKVE
ncbi:MAG: methyl-accepting chemotaxis protein [Treponema sp.]|jgi:methyl-accepting chemotaxis protein|nr:methyl-accepting chemotaxis protein [Treponema sp.]